MDRNGFENQQPADEARANQLTRNKSRYARLNTLNKIDNPDNVLNSNNRVREVFKCRAVGAAKKMQAEWLLEQLNQRIENFKPIQWGENYRGDYEWYVRDEDTAMAIKMTSRQIFHEDSGLRVELQYVKVPSPWMPSEDAIIG